MRGISDVVAVVESVGVDGGGAADGWGKGAVEWEEVSRESK